MRFCSIIAFVFATAAGAGAAALLPPPRVADSPPLCDVSCAATSLADDYAAAGKDAGSPSVSACYQSRAEYDRILAAAARTKSAVRQPLPDCAPAEAQLIATAKTAHAGQTISGSAPQTRAIADPLAPLRATGDGQGTEGQAAAAVSGIADIFSDLFHNSNLDGREPYDAEKSATFETTAEAMVPLLKHSALAALLARRQRLVSASFLAGIAPAPPAAGTVPPAAEKTAVSTPMTVAARADNGDPRMQFLLGLQYYVGDGQVKNPIVAYKWFVLSAARGNAEASEMKTRLRGSLSSTELDEANSLVAAYRAEHPQ